jgi:hypothetical protein
MFKKIHFISFIIFMISIYFGFLYVLSMMTDVTVLNFYQDYLDSSVGTYVIEAQATNRQLFDIWLFLVVLTVVLYIIKITKNRLGIKRYITSMIAIISGVVINVMSINQMNDLDALYQVTDTSWPAGYPITAEMLGYIEPSHFFVGIGPTVFTVTLIIGLCFMFIHTIQFVTDLRGNKR